MRLHSRYQCDVSFNFAYTHFLMLSAGIAMIQYTKEPRPPDKKFAAGVLICSSCECPPRKLSKVIVYVLRKVSRQVWQRLA